MSEFIRMDPRKMEAHINIFERGVTGVNVVPWTPDKIMFKSGGVKYATYNVMDIGEVKKAIGTNLFTVSWNGRFPGPNNQNHPFVFKNGFHQWADPEYWQSCFSVWKRDKTHLQLMITNTPIFHNVVLSDYDVTYKEGNGDYYYYVEFQEDREPTFTITVDEPDVTDTIERDWDAEYDTYTVLDTDTLWGIAQCYLGSGLRESEIYELNKDVIEETAVKHGFSSSNNGWWIFPGTVLKLPKVANGGNSSQGASIELNNVPIYIDSETSVIAARKTGSYYLYDGKNINGRYRITHKLSLCNKKPAGEYVTGWIDSEYI